MKKLILIPSLAIASSLPALCAVSCGNAEASSKWSLEEGEFVWTHGLASGSVVDNDAAINKYFNEIDNKLLADDMLKFIADSIFEHKEYYKRCEFEVKVTKIDKKAHRISFTMHRVIAASLVNSILSSNITFTYTNFPVKLFFGSLNEVSLDNYWMLRPVEVTGGKNLKIPEFYRKDTKWSFSMNGTLSEQEINDTLNYKTPDESHSTAIKYCFVNPIIQASWYFQNVSMNS